MAAQNSWCSGSSRSTARTQRRMILCYHEEPTEQVECDFFQWVDKRRVDQEQTEEDPKMARLRRKVASLKLKVKSIEWKLNVAALVGFFGWLCVFALLGTNAGLIIRS
ncbi:hypothetical protein PIB30_023132 [Stylosanthes scabra]|uniref:Zinc finger GRF-type domain-containing protein n=1 Tax=Stylosanthes scabra TaxID=79078 RepID=A0ABU6Q998_9FABA|nr:hypothetical protein [Stylosanthes scabra]